MNTDQISFSCSALTSKYARILFNIHNWKVMMWTVNLAGGQFWKPSFLYYAIFLFMNLHDKCKDAIFSSNSPDFAMVDYKKCWQNARNTEVLVSLKQVLAEVKIF